MVLREKLSDHEADLILSVQRKAYPTGGSVVVALIGHNQAINSGERGIVAWLDAAERNGWTFSIADKTLDLAELQDREKWATHQSRSTATKRTSVISRCDTTVTPKLRNGLAQCLMGMCPWRNPWRHTLAENKNTIWLTRSLESARKWAKFRTVGGQRSGLIASSQARRLAAEGLFVDYKPDIATWMLAPSNDIRSSNALETVQNQYYIQGLELDYCVVCWDADLRRENDKWAAYKLSGY